jgi:hypothetical protein
MKNFVLLFTIVFAISYGTYNFYFKDVNRSISSQHFIDEEFPSFDEWTNWYDYQVELHFFRYASYPSYPHWPSYPSYPSYPTKPSYPSNPVKTKWPNYPSYPELKYIYNEEKEYWESSLYKYENSIEMNDDLRNTIPKKDSGIHIPNNIKHKKKTEGKF